MRLVLYWVHFGFRTSPKNFRVNLKRRNLRFFLIQAFEQPRLYHYFRVMTRQYIYLQVKWFILRNLQKFHFACLENQFFAITAENEHFKFYVLLHNSSMNVAMAEIFLCGKNCFRHGCFNRGACFKRQKQSQLEIFDL